MIDRAWRVDYVDQPRLAFSETVLRKFAPGRWWVAVLACASDGSPVGFELALERRLCLREKVLRAYYASVFTVSADHRRQGLGRFILEGINRLVFEEHGGDLILSTFQEGHAGSPTVQSTFDRIADWGVVRFHRSEIWARRLDRDLPAPPQPAPRVVRLERSDDDAPAGLRVAATADAVIDVPRLETIDRLLRNEFTTSFELSASLAARYLRPGDEASGTLFYDLGSGRFALVCFNILPMAINERRLRPIGQLQLLLAPGCSEDEIERVVRHLALDLAERGCFALTLVDLGMVPRSALEGVGLVATEDRIAFAARGPRSTIEAFERLRPPFFLDFT